MKLGIGGVVTFKNGKIDTFLKEIDLKHMVLETDSPYLAPVPYRGKRNESAYLVNVLEKVHLYMRWAWRKLLQLLLPIPKEVFGM